MQRELWQRRILAGLGSAAVVCGLLVTTATPAAAAAGLDNGGFEQPTIEPEHYRTIPTGGTVGAWRVVSGDVDIIHKNFWQPAEGNQSLDLNGFERGTIEQDLDTLPLLTYKVSFSLAGNPDHQGEVTGQLLAGGKVIKNLSFDTTGRTKADMGWKTQTASFQSNTTSTKLTFRSTSPQFASGPVLDNVKVQQCLLVLCLPG